MNKTMIDAEALLTDKVALARAALVLAILAGTAWWLFGGNESAEGENTPLRYTHMHCSACKEEVPYNPRQVGKPCEACDAGGVFVATVGSLEEQTNSEGILTKVIVLAVVGAVLMQGWLYLSVLRLRGMRTAAAAARDRTLVCQCPFCRRKIGYPAARAESGLVCPRCKTGFMRDQP
jgi:hypothetical protein